MAVTLEVKGGRGETKPLLVYWLVLFVSWFSTRLPLKKELNKTTALFPNSASLCYFTTGPDLPVSHDEAGHQAAPPSGQTHE